MSRLTKELEADLRAHNGGKFEVWNEIDALRLELAEANRDMAAQIDGNTSLLNRNIELFQELAAAKASNETIVEAHSRLHVVLNEATRERDAANARVEELLGALNFIADCEEKPGGCECAEAAGEALESDDAKYGEADDAKEPA